MKIFILYILLPIILISCEDNSTASNPWDGIDGTWRVTGEEPHLQGFKATKNSFTKYGIVYNGGWDNEGYFFGHITDDYGSRILQLNIVAPDSIKGTLELANSKYSEFTAKRVSDF